MKIKLLLICFIILGIGCNTGPADKHVTRIVLRNFERKTAIEIDYQETINKIISSINYERQEKKGSLRSKEIIDIYYLNSARNIVEEWRYYYTFNDEKLLANVNDFSNCYENKRLDSLLKELSAETNPIYFSELSK